MHRAAGQPPQQEAVDRAEGQLAALGRRARARHLLEQPGELGGGEIGVDHAARCARAPAPRGRPPTSVRQSSAVRRSCQTIARWTGAPVVRCHRHTVSRWLVMPIAATSRAPRPRPGERARGRRERVLPDRLEVVLDPAGAADSAARARAARSRPAARPGRTGSPACWSCPGRSPGCAAPPSLSPRSGPRRLLAERGAAVTTPDPWRRAGRPAERGGWRALPFRAADGRQCCAWPCRWRRRSSRNPPDS